MASAGGSSDPPRQPLVTEKFVLDVAELDDSFPPPEGVFLDANHQPVPEPDLSFVRLKVDLKGRAVPDFMLNRRDGGSTLVRMKKTDFTGRHLL